MDRHWLREVFHSKYDEILLPWDIVLKSVRTQEIIQVFKESHLPNVFTTKAQMEKQM